MKANGIARFALGVTLALVLGNGSLLAQSSEGALYVVRAVKFYCGDESGKDYTGSDEPYWVYTARYGKGHIKTNKSIEFGGVDSGTTKQFDPTQSYSWIWPQKGRAATGEPEGAAAPIEFSIQLWESDQGSREKMVEATHDAFLAAEKVPLYGDFLKSAPDIVKKFLMGKIAKALGDDLMGSETFSFTADQLSSRLPQVGNRFTEKRHFSGHGPDYDLYFEVVRVR
jgi:hypothetical protein